MAKKENDYSNPYLQLRISHEMDERLERVSSMYGVSKNEVARIAIGQYVGQITGSMDQMINRVVADQKIDLEKLVEAMVPKMVEQMKEV